MKQNDEKKNREKNSLSRMPNAMKSILLLQCNIIVNVMCNVHCACACVVHAHKIASIVNGEMCALQTACDCSCVSHGLL